MALTVGRGGSFCGSILGRVIDGGAGGRSGSSCCVDAVGFGCLAAAGGGRWSAACL